MSGHLFVIHGDLRRLACDALIIPCDSSGDVNSAWQELLPRERVAPGASNWLRVSGFEGPHAALPEVDNRAVHLVDTVGGMHSVGALVDRTLEAVRRAASTVQRRTQRALPLVALPLVGTGAGGLAHRRGAVVAAVVDRLADEVAGAPFDVALVVRDPRDVAAIQEARSSQAWPELDDALLVAADKLGEKAARGELSLFLGAGVSIPAGLPLWGRLLEELAEAARLPKPRLESGDDYLRAAEKIKGALTAERYHELMRERFDVDRYALGHGLLAGLSLQRLVTTNYDPCMELALAPVLGADGFRVLTRHLAGGDKPWLLKLHGDIAKPDTLVLSESDYDRYADHGRALYGVVQGLMLTSHLMFVGFSLVDRNFLHLAEAVKRVRREAEDVRGDTAAVAGTALALRPGQLDAEKWKDDLDVLAVSQDGSREEAARRLEIFLDRLAWRADRSRDLSAQYFLDERYDEQFAEEADTRLRDELRHLIDRLPAEVSHSSGWRVVDKALRDLGASSSDLAKFSESAGGASVGSRQFTAHRLASMLGRHPQSVSDATTELPGTSGMYAWWMRPDVLPNIDGPANPEDPEWRLAYVGIAARLRSRVVHNHLRRSGSSTLRRVLAGLLMQEQGYRTRWTDRVVLEEADEARLSAWMHEYLALTWAAVEDPQTHEKEVIGLLRPPLNVNHASSPEFLDVVKAARQTFRESGGPRPVSY